MLYLSISCLYFLEYNIILIWKFCLTTQCLAFGNVFCCPITVWFILCCLYPHIPHYFVEKNCIWKVFMKIIEGLDYNLPVRVFWCFYPPHIAIWMLFKQFTDLNSWDTEMNKALAEPGDSCCNSSYTHSWASCLWCSSQ